MHQTICHVTCSTRSGSSRAYFLRWPNLARYLAQGAGCNKFWVQPFSAVAELRLEQQLIRQLGMLLVQ